MDDHQNQEASSRDAPGGARGPIDEPASEDVLFAESAPAGPQRNEPAAERSDEGALSVWERIKRAFGG